MNDFYIYLKEINFTEEQLEDWMKYMDKYYYVDTKSNIYYKNKSSIQGVGLFAQSNINRNSIIGDASIKDKRTPLARFINHSNNPNVVFKKNKKNIIGFALKNIKKDEELLVDYRHESLTALKRIVLKALKIFNY